MISGSTYYRMRDSIVRRKWKEAVPKA